MSFFDEMGSAYTRLTTPDPTAEMTPPNIQQAIDDGFIDEPPLATGPRTEYLNRETPQEANPYRHEYKVASGDTLSKIALDNNTTVEALADLNELEDVDSLALDQELEIPEYAPPASFEVPSELTPSPKNEFYQYIGDVAEGDHGSEPVTSNDAADVKSGKATYDIGFGHKITAEETKSGKIHGIPFGKGTPLSEDSKRKILHIDMNKNIKLARGSSWDKKLKDIGTTWGKLGEGYRLALTSLAFNVGGTKASDEWITVLKAASDKDPVEFAKQLRRQDAKGFTKGMDNRVMKELFAAGFITDSASFKKSKAVLPLADWTHSFDKTPRSNT